MKKLVFSLFLLSLNGAIFAQCIGSGSVRSCYDYNTGNSYQINRLGNMTTVNGYNANTGSSWSQTSNRIGNTTYTNGYDKDGNSWNSTTQRVGNYRFTTGTDSDGNYFSRTCNQFGCY